MLFISLLSFISCRGLVVSDNETPRKIPLDINVVVPLEDLSPGAFIQEEIVLRKRRGFDPDKVPYRLEVIDTIPAIRVEVLRVPDGLHTLQLIRELRRTGQFEFVEPNLVTTVEEPAQQSPIPVSFIDGNPDPFRYLQWHMTAIQVDHLGSDAQGQGVRVAILDGGFAADAEDAPIHVLEGYDFIEENHEPIDVRGHGTHVTGTVAQATHNGKGGRGVAPESEILPVKVVADTGTGTSRNRADGIMYAVDHNADIINMSINTNQQTAIEASALDYALQNGVVVISSSGNASHNNRIFFPASYEGVIAVGAVNLENQVTDYSNKGQELDFTAPGGDNNEDLNNDGNVDGVLQEGISNGVIGYYLQEGTSMAAPHVAGGYAALMSAGFSAEEVTEALIETAMDKDNPGWDPRYGHGVIQLKDAYNYLRPPLDITALQAKYLAHREELVIQHFTEDTVKTRLCAFQLQDNEEICIELPNNPNRLEQRVSLIGVSTEDFTLYLTDSVGNEYSFGPYSIDVDRVEWQDVVTCESDAKLFNVYLAANQQRTQIDFTTSEYLQIELCIEQNTGIVSCNDQWFEGNGQLSTQGSMTSAEVNIRDASGCTTSIENLPSFIGTLPQR